VTGSYASSTGLFTIAASGADTLLVYDDNGNDAGANYRGIVLVGYIDTGTADTYTSTGSGAAGEGHQYLVVL
jgi:hypothetical protein